MGRTFPPSSCSNMRFESAMAAVSYLGIVVHFGGTIVLVVLFALLHRFVFRRAYFSAWAGAWLSILVALAALVVRFAVLPQSTPPAGELGWVDYTLMLGYQVAKLTALVLFFQGTRSYVSGARWQSHRLATFAWPFAYAVVTTLLTRANLGALVVWQSVVAVVLLGSSAWMLLSLAPSRRTPGSLAAAATFGLLAALWAAYGLAFGVAAYGFARHAWTTTVVDFNSYFDLLVDFLLGFGMVVMLMEDAKREVDDAQAELRVAHDQLRRAALYDSLTGSLNRRAFVEGVGLEMARATFGTVAIADVDDLKGVNDSHGHGAGDRLLQHCADVLRAALRPYDKLYRWGGDEFLIVVPSAHASVVEARLREQLDQAAPAPLGGSAGVRELRVSLGVADYGSAEEIAAAIERADRAMYVQKRGRKAAQEAALPLAEARATARR